MKAKILIPVGILILIVGAFQNCGSGLETSPISLGQTLSAPGDGLIPLDEGPGEACMFDGELVPPGEHVVAYTQSTVPYGEECLAQIRTCHANGLSGNAPYASCEVGAPASCLHSGVTVAHGASIIAYEKSSVAFGESCKAATLTCSNGGFDNDSENYPFPACEVGAPASCSYNGGVLQHGQSIMAYMESSVPYGQSCQSVHVSCSNGELSNGSAVHANCSVAPPEISWVNASSYAETHAQACARVGRVPAGNQGYGVCASGESRPKVGLNYQNISYRYGTWGGASSGGLVVGPYCYKSGQKRDNDSTDLIVAYLCSQ